MRNIRAITVWVSAALVLSPIAAAAQAPRKARATTPRPAAATAHFSGRVVQLRGRALPGINQTLTAFYAQQGDETKRFVVRFTDTADAPRTRVVRDGKTLTRSEIVDALNLEGLHVEVDYEPEPYKDWEAYNATLVSIGEMQMGDNDTSMPVDLVVEDIVEGTGPVAESGHEVTVHYTGWLRDGTKFDSSLDRGKPFQFRLGARQVIAGWDRGVAGMKVGGKRRLIIPPDLGYGARGAGRAIPPNAVLVFEVELLGVR